MRTTIVSLMNIKPMARATPEQTFECLNTWLYKASLEVHSAMSELCADSDVERLRVISTVRCNLLREETLPNDTRLLFGLYLADSGAFAALVRMDIDPDSQRIIFVDAVGIHGPVTDHLVENVRRTIGFPNADRSLWCAALDDDVTKLLGPHEPAVETIAMGTSSMSMQR